MQVTRLGKHTIRVHLHGEARDALFPPIITADIEWEWDLTILAREAIKNLESLSH